MDRTLAARISLVVVSIGATAALFVDKLSEGNFMILATAVFFSFFDKK